MLRKRLRNLRSRKHHQLKHLLRKARKWLLLLKLLKRQWRMNLVRRLKRKRKKRTRRKSECHFTKINFYKNKNKWSTPHNLTKTQNRGNSTNSNLKSTKKQDRSGKQFRISSKSSL